MQQGWDKHVDELQLRLYGYNAVYYNLKGVLSVFKYSLNTLPFSWSQEYGRVLTLYFRCVRVPHLFHFVFVHNNIIYFISFLKTTLFRFADYTYYMENLSKHFPFIGSRIDFSSLHNYKLVKSDQGKVSFDVVNFIQKLIEEKIFSKEDEIIYIGDSLTEVGYEFYLKDLVKVIPFIIDEIPQHHYFLSKDFKKIIYISFENEIEFGEVL